MLTLGPDCVAAVRVVDQDRVVAEVVFVGRSFDLITMFIMAEQTDRVLVISRLLSDFGSPNDTHDKRLTRSVDKLVVVR